MKRLIRTILFAAILGLAMFINSSAAQDSGNLLEYMIEIAGLANPQFTSGYLVLLVMGMIPLFVGEIIFGLHLYSHFCTASVYFFSRQDNRVEWYVKETVCLMGKICIYLLTYLITVFAAGWMVYRDIFPVEGIRILGYILIYFTLYTFIFSILLNAFSVILGSHLAFPILYVIQLILVLSFMLFESEVPQNGVGLWILKYNPISNIIVSWHSSERLFPELLNRLPIKFGLNSSAVYLAALALGASVIGGIIICTQDIALDNKEELG